MPIADTKGPEEKHGDAEKSVSGFWKILSGSGFGGGVCVCVCGGGGGGGPPQPVCGKINLEREKYLYILKYKKKI